MGRSGGVGVYKGVGVGKGGLERETEEILHWRGGGVLCFGRIQWSVDIKGMHMFCSTHWQTLYAHIVSAY